MTQKLYPYPVMSGELSLAVQKIEIRRDRKGFLEVPSDQISSDKLTANLSSLLDAAADTEVEFDLVVNGPRSEIANLEKSDTPLTVTIVAECTVTNFRVSKYA